MSKTVETPPPHWVLVTRGSFVVGRCAQCGWEAPARRAHQTTSEDMLTHHREAHGYEGKPKHLDTIEVKAKGLTGKDLDKKVRSKVKARFAALQDKQKQKKNKK